MSEEWREVIGFPDYQVSNLGRVKSLNYMKTKKEQILKPQISIGYYYIQLGRGNCKRVNRLVAQAFLPNPENLRDCDHINRNKLDNRVENLRWSSRSDNLKNRDYLIRETNTGEPNISFIHRDEVYLVRKIIKGKQHTGRYHTLEEAVQFRDALLSL